jgi:hypothetical protein
MGFRAYTLSLAAVSLLVSTGLSARQQPAAAAPGKASAPSKAPAIAWEKSLDAARARAQRENKPLFVLQMFGRLDEAFC